MEENKPSYYAIIPANIRYDKRVPANAKLLYGEITALCNDKGYCWATNGYFAKLYGVSETSISKWIKALADGEYIYIQANQNTGNNRHIYLREVFNQNSTPIEEKLKTPIEENLYTPIEEKLKQNNTSNNNKAINNKKNNIKGQEKPFLSVDNVDNSEFDEVLQSNDDETRLTGDNGISYLTEYFTDYFRKQVPDDKISKTNLVEVRSSLREFFDDHPCDEGRIMAMIALYLENDQWEHTLYHLGSSKSMLENRYYEAERGM